MKKAVLYFQVYDKGPTEDGEYISYETEWSSQADLTLFLEKVTPDLEQRFILLGEGKSMITPDIEVVPDGGH